MPMIEAMEDDGDADAIKNRGHPRLFCLVI